ncbi:isocitrate lyase/PEP mutase family protein [Kitasatospora cheerisanensis]|uniref:Phosphorylmutase n=1 Tax=Kitasatospora cheerisanensis KCTC 2395 TaxID=1348663 RepID=A0A066YRK3_9ACTN|nr:isocitrate lyase/phosphoenolpyruvate mutase family protein [Kitasatospora cheerisanensis]KDN83872.1 phosphorylmutase [Kitasatospora cheerisanensis KCTC 2395]
MVATMTAGEFLALHDRTEPSDPLVLPNVWDAVSARAFAEAGFPVLATSSAAVAAVLGYRDGGDTPPDEMFGALKRIVRSVDVPVTADIENGYGLAPVEIVERLLDAGVIGCNLEDSDAATKQLNDPVQHAEWLSEVSVAAGDRLVLNARVDTFLFGDHSVESAAKRAGLYIDAGADVIYPILAPEELLPDLANSIRRPLNALHLPGTASPSRLGSLGAARVTFGGGLQKQSSDDITELARKIGRAYGAQN